MARAIIARDGEDALTLGAVAEEAGLARATIYGFFSGKRDLLAALAADGAAAAPEQSAAVETGAEADGPEDRAVLTTMDYQPELAEIAADVSVLEAQPEPAPPSEPVAAEHPEPVAVATEPEDIAPQPVENVVANEEPQSGAEPVAHTAEALITEEPEQVQEGAGPETPAPSVEVEENESDVLMPYERERRVQAAHLEEIAKRLILPESALKEGTDAVISRLETRLRVLERSIANLETRQTVIPEETTKKIKPVSDLVTQLQTRTDAIEDRQRQAIAELRLNIHELSAKQGALVTTQPAAVPEVQNWPLPTVDPEPEKIDAAPAESPTVEEPVADAVKSTDEDPKTTYLATARNLAREGARQAAERESLEEEEQRSRRRRLLAAAGVAAVCLVTIGVLFEMHPGAHGVSTAQSKAIPPRASVPAHRVADSRAPLDRLTALANKGDAKAELVIGLKYLKGDGTTENDAEAARWFQRAAQSGDPVAENLLGTLYQAGHGVAANTKQSMQWYEAAAQQGNRHAMSNLAVLYASEEQKNPAEAARWFERSANLGYVDAQFNLAVLFERGDGVPQSLLDAYKWYSIASAAGDPVAKTRVEAIATQFSPEELQAAQQAVVNFKPQTMNRAANDVPAMADILASR